jgi:hypothetical protein
LKKPRSPLQDCCASPGRAQDSSIGGSAERSPRLSDNLCEASGEVHPQPSVGVYEVLVAGGLAANCADDQYKELLEQMAPIAEQVAEKLNLQ